MCPAGELARSADEAAAVAKRIGYPVVLKAQAAALSHKTEAGGVVLNLADEAALRAAWDTMQQSVKRAAPGVTLDGCLVEKMSRKGLELMVGAKRDPAGARCCCWASAASGSRRWATCSCCRATRTRAQIVEALQRLRSAKLLAGVRGAPPADIDAVAQRGAWPSAG